MSLDLALRTAERTGNEEAHLLALARAGDELAWAALNPDTEEAERICVDWLAREDREYWPGGAFERVDPDAALRYWSGWTMVIRRFGFAPRRDSYYVWNYEGEWRYSQKEPIGTYHGTLVGSLPRLCLMLRELIQQTKDEE